MQLVTPQRVHLLVVVASVAVSAFTLASLFGRHSYLELATHFRLQYALAASACVLLLVVFRSWKLLPLVVCCAAFNWSLVLPYYSAASRPTPRPAALRLKLMLANVLGSNRDYAALTSVVDESGPDIIVLQEFTGAWQEHLRSLHARYPYFTAAPRPGGSGMALFSRHPLEAAEVLMLDSSTHVALLARVNVEGVSLSVLALHPPTPMRPDKFASRNRQFARAAAIMRVTRGPKLLIGDLNTTMWSPYFAELVRAGGLADARRGFGLSPSWPVPLPAPLRIPIDHCLVGGGVAVEGVRTGGPTGSDHRPLLVDVRLERPDAGASR